MMINKTFSYLLKNGEGWPPTVRPKPPLGPSMVEIVRSCPLRSCFDASPGYERRMDYPARVGTAFHRTLQSFYEKGLPIDREKAVNEARKRFEQELQRQETDARSRPRESALPHDTIRVDRAVESLILEAIRFMNLGYVPPSPHNVFSDSSQFDVVFDKTSSNAPGSPVEVEVPVRSNDGYFQGRIDRVEHTDEGTVIYDFKSALRDDLPGRYQRQIQLYSLMWRDTRNEWPTAGYVVYPLTGKSYQVAIDPDLCQSITDESAELVDRMQKEPVFSRLALPGDTCTVCEYRPWCNPFWAWQADEKSHLRAIERSSLGFSGLITRLDLNNHRWHINLSWRNATVRLSAPEERLPYLHKAQVGQTALVLDTKMQGAPYTPLAVFTEYSELFILTT